MNRAGWTLAGLGVIGQAALAVGLLIALPAVTLVGCAAHEIGHGLTGTALGYEVERIVLCPGAAEVVWKPSPRPPIDGTLVPWAGGFAAAAALGVAYGFLIRGSRPLRNPVVWGVGLAMAAVAGAQVAVGLLEGLLASRYVEAIDARPFVYVPLILASGLAGSAAHMVAWRRVLR